MIATTDPISDMATRIRNAQKAGHAKCSMPASKVKARVAELLKEEGYISDVAAEGSGPTRKLIIHLKYDKEQRGIIDGIQRVSKPGMRVYKGHADLEEVRGGLGVSIVSTSRGLMTDKKARTEKVGGEVILRVW